MKPKLEHRIVCAKHGERGHSSHAYPKRDLAKAQQDVIDANHRAEVGKTDFYRGEAPWTVERREVSPWENIDKVIAREVAVIEGSA